MTLPARARSFAVPLSAAAVLAGSCASGAAAAASPPASGPAASDSGSPRETPAVTLTLLAPSAAGPWAIVVANQGTEPVRVLADARFAVLLVRAPGQGWVQCALPAAMRAGTDPRTAVLSASERYEEWFDPRLFCWGPAFDALGEGGSATVFLGYARGGARAGNRAPSGPPFAVEPVQTPTSLRPVERLVSSTVWWSPAKPQPASRPSAPGAQSAGGPRIELEAPSRVDAPSAREARLTAVVRNTGDRTALVHLRADRLELRVTRPDRQTLTCPVSTRHRAVARDFFGAVPPRGRRPLTVLIAEVCPRRAFERPGAYEVWPALRVVETGERFGLAAVTGDFGAERPTLVRVQTSRLAYEPVPRPESR
jgi:hypothetical protein